jgi:hypothetical protein
LDLFAAPDHPPDALREILLEIIVFREEAGLIERALRLDFDLADGERFDNVVERALPNGLDRLLNRPVGRHHDHRCSWQNCAAFLEHGQAVGLRHFDIGNHQVQRAVPEAADGLLAVGRLHHFKPRFVKDLTQHVPHGGLVVNDKDTFHAQPFPTEYEL